MNNTDTAKLNNEIYRDKKVKSTSSSASIFTQSSTDIRTLSPDIKEESECSKSPISEK